MIYRSIKKSICGLIDYKHSRGALRRRFEPRRGASRQEHNLEVTFIYLAKWFFCSKITEMMIGEKGKAAFWPQFPLMNNTKRRCSSDVFSKALEVYKWFLKTITNSLYQNEGKQHLIYG